MLFTVFANSPGLEKGRLEVLDLKTGKRKVLHHGGTDPRYVPTGHILYLYEQTLFALPFDVEADGGDGEPGAARRASCARPPTRAPRNTTSR